MRIVPWGPNTPDIVQKRLDMAWTIIVDTGVVILAVFARNIALWAIGHLGAPEGTPWAFRVLEFYADIGLVATALLMLLFDIVMTVIRLSQEVAVAWRAER